MPPGAHATLGASSAYRWMACPGSVRLAEGIRGKSTVYAIEGTAAHELAERALREGLDCDFWLDTTIYVERDGEVVPVLVTEEMCGAVQVFVDYCRSRMNKSDEVFIEQQFDLARLVPPAPMFGTADFVTWTECPFAGRELEVVDLKYGQGVMVEVTGNPQLRYYALGALLAIGRRPDRVRITVVQPRAHHPDGPVRSEELTFDELVSFKHELFERAEATQHPDAPLVPGDHCRFCPALALCPAQKAHAIEVAQSDFMDFAPPDPETLTTRELVTVLNAADQLQTWLSTVQAHALGMLERGEEVPGWKLVEGRAARKWRDEEEARATLRKAGLEEDDLYVKKFVSPAQAEKALKTIHADKGVIAEVVERIPGKPKMAPVGDARPALAPSAQDDFDIPSES